MQKNQGKDIEAQPKANCYIVSRYGGWEFRCDVKGNSDKRLPAADSVAVLWESKATLVPTEKAEIIHHVMLDSNKVVFTAGKVDGNAGGHFCRRCRQFPVRRF